MFLFWDVHNVERMKEIQQNLAPEMFGLEIQALKLIATENAVPLSEEEMKMSSIPRKLEYKEW